MGAYAARLQETFANASEVQSHDTFAFEEARAERSQRELVDTWMDVTRSVSSLAALSDIARGVGPAAGLHRGRAPRAPTRAARG
ncbi:MAG: hypothetical protein R3A52_21420 [Polyangiales bacterium]